MRMKGRVIIVIIAWFVSFWIACLLACLLGCSLFPKHENNENNDDDDNTKLYKTKFTGFYRPFKSKGWIECLNVCGRNVSWCVCYHGTWKIIFIITVIPWISLLVPRSLNRDKFLFTLLPSRVQTRTVYAVSDVTMPVSVFSFRLANQRGAICIQA